MKKSFTKKIRDLLRSNPEGMSVQQIYEKIPEAADSNSIRKSLKVMPDVYIDRWTLPRRARGQFQAVWCVVIPPPDCPYPERKKR